MDFVKTATGVIGGAAVGITGILLSPFFGAATFITGAGIAVGAGVGAILGYAVSVEEKNEIERQKKDIESRLKAENKVREDQYKIIIEKRKAEYDTLKSRYETTISKFKKDDKVMMSLFAIGVSAISINEKFGSEDMKFLKTILYGVSSDLIKDETQDILNKLSENPVEWTEALRIAKYELNNEEKEVLNNLLMLIASKYKNMYACIIDLESVI
ncbi:hypothetical protein C672_3482 [[Clostridium] bifermentans ATCC 638]|uniref:Uncharacterized protein n=1 Tax=Paraclostridium bifermentans ATCC 638 = DSM 14991 TaxID=1233171 RepID=T4V8P8_PARBF|nr:glycine zipper family protein [Paraclostridium bifermentans]EQK40099.1 hypothetical protein C672_3482 [[Clostridium] bifermentans ATCC 638] [Paraclostridium bifermentans ATCC 638 = DSM 14991]RIZ57348.1 glycine zipper family protein [Paraclostridium bifermentans]UAG20053.1 glycine zipper family protein [Paraclostridium bifermentans]